MGTSKDLFTRMREQGMDVDCSGQLYNEQVSKCKAYRCPAWGGEEGDWNCDEKECIDNDECKYADYENLD